MSAMDMDLGQLIGKLFNKGGDDSSPADAKTKLIAIAVMLILLIGSFLYFFLLPQYKKVEEMQGKADRLPDVQTELGNLAVARKKANENMLATMAQVETFADMFHSEQDLEALYRELSTIALTNGLTITNVKKLENVPVYEVEKESKKKKKKKKKKKDDQLVAYTHVPVQLDFTGFYLNYIGFRNDLAAMEKLININSESIRILETENSEGEVVIQATLSTYRMPEPQEKEDQEDA